MSTTVNAATRGNSEIVNFYTRCGGADALCKVERDARHSVRSSYRDYAFGSYNLARKIDTTSVVWRTRNAKTSCTRMLVAREVVTHLTASHHEVGNRAAVARKENRIPHHLHR